MGNLQPQHKSHKLSQSDEFSSILGALNHELLDDYQIELFKLLKDATQQNITTYFNNHSHILYKFLITLYITSLDKWNPLRTEKHNDILSEFQNAFKQKPHSPPSKESSFKEPDLETNYIPQPPMAFSMSSSSAQPPMAFSNNSSLNNQSLLLQNSVLLVKSNDNLRKSSFAKQIRKIRKIKKSLP